MSHREPETESIIFLTGGSCGWKCTDLSLISDTATVMFSTGRQSAGEDRRLSSVCFRAVAADDKWINPDLKHIMRCDSGSLASRTDFCVVS